jgi:eukaryotic-like serine/threonine-protein kinase
MPSLFKLMSCSEGHFWETSESGPATLCPVCGGTPESWPLVGPPPDDGSSGEIPVATLAPASPPAPKPTFSRRPVVPGYEILEDRGRTPAGVAVYLAKQELVPRKVLLKVVTAAEDRGQRAWGALRGEAVALGKISHPNVIQFYEAGDRNREQFYNAVEFVDGPTLAQKWSAKPLPYRQAAAIVEVLARAVQHAHDQGVVHRALRPAAVQLQLHKSEGQSGTAIPPFCLVHSMRCIPKVADFGLARRPTEGDVNDLDLQQGMPSYLAPEQVWGRAKDIGPATDVYALGAILYELVSGVPPFLGPTLSDTLDLIQSRQVRPPERHRRGVPADLSVVCLKCLEKQPRQRYASAAALADDLRRFLDGKPVKDCRGGLLTKLWRTARRSPVATILLFCTVGLAVALASVSTNRGHERQTVLPLALVPPPLAASVPRGPQQVEGQSRDRQLQAELPRQRVIVTEPRPSTDPCVVYAHDLALAMRATQAGDRVRAREYLARCRFGLREWEWHALRQLVEQESRPRRPRPDAPVSGLACSPDGRFLAGFGRNEKDNTSSITIWDDKGEQVFLWKPVEFELSAIAWTSDSAALMALDKKGRATTIGLEISRKAGGPIMVTPKRSGKLDGAHGPASLALRGPGNDRLIGVSYGTDVHVYREAQAVAQIATGSEDVAALALCPEKRYLATGDRRGMVKVWDLATGLPLVVLEGHTAEITALAFSWGGKRLVSGGRDGALCVWDVGECREVIRFEGPAGGPTALEFQGDGLQLAVACGYDVELWGKPPR